MFWDTIFTWKVPASESIRNSYFNWERLSRFSLLARPEISTVERPWNSFDSTPNVSCSESNAFRIVNFPHMDSNIPANPAYGVYISQLVRYARICTSKVDFINRLRGLSLRLRQQGFETNLLQKSFNKFFSRHSLIVEKYGAALREMRLAIQAWIAPSYPYTTYLLHSVYFSCISVRERVQFYFERAHYLFIYLIDVYI